MSRETREINENAEVATPTLTREDTDLLYAAMWELGAVHGWRHVDYWKNKSLNVSQVRDFYANVVKPGDFKKCFDMAMKDLKTDIVAAGGNPAALESVFVEGYKEGVKGKLSFNR